MGKKVIILDHNTISVHVFKFDSDIYDEDDIVRFLDDVNLKYDLNLKEDECSWMFADNSLKIKIHSA